MSNKSMIGRTISINIISKTDPDADAAVVLAEPAALKESGAVEVLTTDPMKISVSAPEWIDSKHGEREQLERAYCKAMELAYENGCSSIVLPTFYSGISGYLTDPAICTIVSACRSFLDQHPDITFHIILSVDDDDQYAYVNRELQWQGVSRYKVADRTDWKIKEMPAQHDEFELEGYFPEKLMSVLRHGHIPLAMEDKWFWFMEGDTLFAHRSWTGFCIYSVEFGEKRLHVTVNRDPEQYSETDIIKDVQRLIRLLSLWTQDEYDYYGEWLTETFYKIKPHLENTEQSKAYRKSLDYFMHKSWGTSDFSFPPELLDQLHSWERPQIEDKIIKQALYGDNRFYRALKNIKCYDLQERFNAESMSDLAGEDRIRLLYELYCATYDTVYLKNIVYLMPGNQFATYKFSRILERDDWWEDGEWETPGVQNLMIAVKAIRDIRGKNQKLTKWRPEMKDNRERRRSLHKTFRKLPAINREQIRSMADIEGWEFPELEKYSRFWEALDLKLEYAETKDKTALKKIIDYSLTNSAVYDILNAMYKDEEVTEAEILGILGE